MRLVWRSLAALSLPLTLAGCPGDDTTTPDDDGSDSTTTTGTSTTTGPAESSTSSAESSTSSAESSTSSAESSTSSAESSSTTTAVAETGDFSICGNNVIEGEEVCDLNQLNGETCVSLGYQGGVLGCKLTCDDYNLLGCFICGNEVVDIAEDCEGGIVPEGVTCESLGYEAGTLACGADCLWDLTECSICGDGIQQGPENCDGIDLGGETCVSLGFDMGNLGCVQASCAYDYSGCAGGQYFQDFEIGMIPPEFTVAGAQGFEVDNNMPVAGMFSAHSGPITHNQESSLLISALFAVDGDISFVHTVSSEACCDHLEFYIDGVFQQQWSGNGVGVMSSFPVMAGPHDFEWRYDKDGSVNTASDTVWVDDITMIPGVPI